MGFGTGLGAGFSGRSHTFEILEKIVEAVRHRLAIAPPPPPEHLAEPERVLWSKLHAEYKLREAPTLAILTATLDSHARSRLCRQQIEEQGMTMQDRWGQTKPHPLLATERDARAGFLAGMRALGLDVVGN
jgi:phage terminase small subunit